MNAETITIDGRAYRRFIRHPGPVTDGTARCFSCGQIDEPEYHDDAMCPAMHARKYRDHPAYAVGEIARSALREAGDAA